MVPQLHVEINSATPGISVSRSIVGSVPFCPGSCSKNLMLFLIRAGFVIVGKGHGRQDLCNIAILQIHRIQPLLAVVEHGVLCQPDKKIRKILLPADIRRRYYTHSSGPGQCSAALFLLRSRCKMWEHPQKPQTPLCSPKAT